MISPLWRTSIDVIHNAEEDELGFIATLLEYVLQLNGAMDPLWRNQIVQYD